MYNFVEEEHKYRLIYTDDKKHYLLLCQCVVDGQDIRYIADKYGLVVEGEEEGYNAGGFKRIVYENPDKERFLIAIGALIRRLAPFKAFDFLYPWFWRTDSNRLVTEGYYLYKKDSGPCPFVTYNEKKHGKLIKMELPHE